LKPLYRHETNKLEKKEPHHAVCAYKFNRASFRDGGQKNKQTKQNKKGEGGKFKGYKAPNARIYVKKMSLRPFKSVDFQLEYSSFYCVS